LSGGTKWYVIVSCLQLFHNDTILDLVSTVKTSFGFQKKRCREWAVRRSSVCPTYSYWKVSSFHVKSVMLHQTSWFKQPWEHNYTEGGKCVELVSWSSIPVF